jgi:hypothetical protein
MITVDKVVQLKETAKFMSDVRGMHQQNDGSLSHLLDYIKREFGMIDKEMEAIKLRIMMKENKRKS